jgi:hypothetical protein
LLGIDVDPEGRLQARSADSLDGPKLRPMHLAMLRARLAVARTPGGAGTWGAYQHYGNPYYRILSGRGAGH